MICFYYNTDSASCVRNYRFVIPKITGSTRLPVLLADFQLNQICVPAELPDDKKTHSVSAGNNRNYLRNPADSNAAVQTKGSGISLSPEKTVYSVENIRLCLTLQF